MHCAGADIVFFAAGATTSRRHAPVVAEAGGVAVDKSSAYRMDPARSPGRPRGQRRHDIATHHGIVANPNCVAIPLTIVLAPLQRCIGLRHVTVATYQAASGAGIGLADELETQARDDAAGVAPTAHACTRTCSTATWCRAAGPWREPTPRRRSRSSPRPDASSMLPSCRMSITTVRVPSRVGHSAAVWVELDAIADADDVRALLRNRRGSWSSTTRDAALSDATNGRRQRRRPGRTHPPRSPAEDTASRCSSVPTTCARALRQTRCRWRSCCWQAAERTPDGSPGHARRGALNSANGGDDRRGPRAPRAGS